MSPCEERRVLWDELRQERQKAERERFRKVRDEIGTSFAMLLSGFLEIWRTRPLHCMQKSSVNILLNLSNGFGITWGLIHDDRYFDFGWTVFLKAPDIIAVIRNCLTPQYLSAVYCRFVTVNQLVRRLWLNISLMSSPNMAQTSRKACGMHVQQLYCKYCRSRTNTVLPLTLWLVM